MVVAETDAIAEDLVDQVQRGSLADDDGFNRWVDEAGGSGILTGYVSAEAPMAMLELFEGDLESAAAGSLQRSATDRSSAGRQQHRIGMKERQHSGSVVPEPSLHEGGVEREDGGPVTIGEGA